MPYLPGSRKKIILILAVIIFTGGFIYVFATNLQLRKSVADLKKEKEIEFKQQLGRERDLIQKDLDEKYSVNTASFEALAKRLEIETRRTKEIEGRLKKEK